MRKLNRNKKGMFFTIIAMALLSLFLVSYTFYAIVQDRKTVNKRIDTMNGFVFSMEQDLPRQLYTSGFRIIFLLEKQIAETGNYTDNFDLVFENAFFNGTIDGQQAELMNGAKFPDIEFAIQEKANKLNLNVTFLSPQISVSQEDPWNIKVVLTSILSVRDKGDLALWNKTLIVEEDIPIENFEDPIYVVSTTGFVTNKINKTIYDYFVNDTNVTNLNSHLTNSYYIASDSAPSFLNRLQGNLSANENGIESLVYLPGLSAQGVSVKDKSCVDYIYFSTLNPTYYAIQGMPSWFKIDENHLDIYNVSGLTI